MDIDFYFVLFLASFKSCLHFKILTVINDCDDLSLCIGEKLIILCVRNVTITEE